jgi:hypothetical protein
MPGNFSRPRSSYTLPDVKSKLKDNKVNITFNARKRAYEDFGWSTSDILDAYTKLRPTHFYTTLLSNTQFPLMYDVYKGTINGEEIYTHFYIDQESGYLIINSFHKR